MYGDIEQQSDLFNLVQAIRDELLNPSTLFTRPRKVVARSGDLLDIGVRGSLRIDDVAVSETYDAECIFIASTAWRSNPLKVFCIENWMKAGVEWHQMRDGPSWYLCYELPERWEDRIGKVAAANDTLATIEFAKEFCLRASRSLIEKHLFAHRQNITKWPGEWDAWPHNRLMAIRQFHNELRLAG